MTRLRIVVLGLVSLVTQGALGQSLYLTAGYEDLSDPGTVPLLIEDVSLTYIPEPEIKEWRAHDIVTIIIDEVSRAESTQTLETEKESTSAATINTLVDALQLLELRLREQALEDLALIDFTAEREFTGEGEYEREDRFSARIAATVLEVKPNGTVVLEARKRIEKDDEVQTIVLSGVARTEDITLQNTILSSQLADLMVSSKNEGEVRDAAKKGIITKFFDTLFAF